MRQIPRTPFTRISASHCKESEKFEQWVAREVLAGLGKSPTWNDVRQAQNSVANYYYSAAKDAPEDCRSNIGNKEHRCIWHVFMDSFGTLREKERSIVPIFEGRRQPNLPSLNLPADFPLGATAIEILPPNQEFDDSDDE